MSEQDPDTTGNTAQDPTRDDATSPLRGDLSDNAFDAGTHDMGGDIGPADDSSTGETSSDE